ncbi:MAG: asparaginase [Endozoicomonas sp. (ex Botrylloides leachii)]|nr:asparaginase [Endozoicomonas sp. (ex Botrylloides leachii)]
MTKKIYVAYTGGTIGMEHTQYGYSPASNLMTLINQKLSQDVMDNLPQFELHEYDKLIDSSNICPDNWKQMAEDIANRYQAYDGFVILHGTDTMAYSSSMLSFMLQNLQKPIIFTGSQIPLCEARTDALENFITALIIASDERVKEVCLYFNRRLMRGNRSLKVNAHGFDGFDSPHYPDLGRVGIDINLNEQYLWQPQGVENFQLACDVRSHVLPLSLFPGITSDWLKIALNQPYSAFVLRTYGTGNGPDKDKALINVLTEACERGIIIVNQSQCYRGAVKQGYASGSALNQAGLLNSHDATPEALFCKLQHLFSVGKTPEQVRRLVNINLSGELTD